MNSSMLIQSSKGMKKGLRLLGETVHVFIIHDGVNRKITNR
jgi:hypothetical protein